MVKDSSAYCKILTFCVTLFGLGHSHHFISSPGRMSGELLSYPRRRRWRRRWRGRRRGRGRAQKL